MFESEQFTTAPSTITVINPIASWEIEDVSVKPEEIQQGQDNAKNGMSGGKHCIFTYNTCVDIHVNE